MFIKILMYIKYGPVSQQNEHRQNEKATPSTQRCPSPATALVRIREKKGRCDGKLCNFKVEILKANTNERLLLTLQTQQQRLISEL